MSEATRSGDLGPLLMRLDVDKARRRCALNFGKEVTWLDCPPMEARGIAAAFRDVVRQNFGELAYDPTTLPIMVHPDRARHRIVVTLPQPASVLIVNPEVL